MELTMKKYTLIITDADVRFEIETAATGLEEENQVHFPDGDARAEFLEDCVSCILDKFDLYEHYPARITAWRFSTPPSCTATCSEIYLSPDTQNR